MKRIIEEYGEGILYLVYGMIVSGLLIQVLKAVSSV